MKQKIQRVEEIDVGEVISLESVKIAQLGENDDLVQRFFDVKISNDSSSGGLEIIIGEQVGKLHTISISGGRINIKRTVKNMDSTKLNSPGEVEWLKEDGKWGTEPVVSKRVNAPFEFHMRDIVAQ